MLLEGARGFFRAYLPTLAASAPNALYDDLTAALDLEDRPHATLLKRVLELTACAAFTARTLDARRPRTWLYESARNMLSNIEAVRESPARLKLLTLCLCALLASKAEAEENAKLLPLLLSATTRMDEAQQASNATAASALMYTRTKSVQLTSEATEFTWTCDAPFAQGFMLYLTRVRLPGTWRLRVTGARLEALLAPNINWCMHTDALLLPGTEHRSESDCCVCCLCA